LQSSAVPLGLSSCHRTTSSMRYLVNWDGFKPSVAFSSLPCRESLMISFAGHRNCNTTLMTKAHIDSWFFFDGGSQSQFLDLGSVVVIPLHDLQDSLICHDTRRLSEFIIAVFRDSDSLAWISPSWT
jgi:hypothetical protein